MFDCFYINQHAFNGTFYEICLKKGLQNIKILLENLVINCKISRASWGGGSK